MSTSYGKEVKYTCFNDCRQQGCPGHTLRAVHHNTSDILSFEIDGREEYCFDYNCFKAMCESMEEAKRS
jgi:hypothetical protein